MWHVNVVKIPEWNRIIIFPLLPSTRRNLKSKFYIDLMQEMASSKDIFVVIAAEFCSSLLPCFFGFFFGISAAF